jgi:tetratricopeptide (TPR) repeat protein
MQYQWTEWDEDVTSSPDEEYQSLVRSLRRKMGFGLFFVRCSPVGGQELIERVRADVPQKQADVLELKEPIANLIDLVKVFPNIDNIKILFVVGLEKSLVEYIRTGYGGQGDYYNLDTVPPILSHLNWQRENFRDKCRHLCFVFLLPRFAIKYILRRAPDFYDWASGKTDIPSSQELVAQESQRILLEGDFQKYLEWIPQKRKERIIDELLLEPDQNQDQRASLLFEQGNIFVANNQNEEALSAYDRTIQFKPSLHQAWNNRGCALVNLGRYEEAIVTYDRALQFKPDLPQAWQNRGIALDNLGRYEEAIASCDKAVAINPDYYQAWLERGYCFEKLGQYEESRKSHSEAVRIKPDYAEGWYNQGVQLGNLGRYEEAIASFDRALEFKPDRHEAWNNRGSALDRLGRNEEAIASFDRALEFKPDYHQAWYNRGIVLGNLCRYEEAITSYKKALEIKPDDPNPYFNKACAYSLQNQIELALENLQKAIQLNPEKCREMSKTDSDFDNIRHDPRFQALIQ